jgi:hypothetical protein
MSNTATETDTRRWNAFVCSDCRAIFRVPLGHAGLGVVCPACERMLRLPKASDSIPELVIQQQSITSKIPEVQVEAHQIKRDEQLDESEVITARSDENTVAKTEMRRRKKRRESNYTDVETEWQQGANKKMLRFDKPRAPWWMLAAVAVLSLLLVSVVSLLLVNKTNSQPKISAPVFNPDSLSTVPSVKPIIKQDFNLAKIEELAKAFINAKTVNELLVHVRQLPEIEQKIRDYYQRVPYTSAGFAGFGELSVVADDQGVVIVSFQTKNFETRELYLCKDGDEYAIDWESWVGWSAMDFAELKMNKPTAAVEVRVTLAAESYYNFDFPPNEESRWQSYRLIYPDGESILHGYVEKATPIDNQLRLAPDEKSKQMTLLIKYRENSSTNDQVLIEKIVTEGWVK